MCGIIGAVSREDNNVAPEIYAGLWSLQHRGKESAGMVTYEDGKLEFERGMGTVETVFGDNILSRLCGKSGIGHVRYSTAGESSLTNAQPVSGYFQGEQFWLAHNGNLVRYMDLRSTTEKNGYAFQTTIDTELIAALIHLSKCADFGDALEDALSKVEGTYALIALYRGQVFGVRDPTGNRPLVIGKGRGMTILASESAACDVLAIQTLRDVEPGEMIVIDPVLGNWYNIKNTRVSAPEKFCIFEYVYFLRPDSKFLGRRAQSVREQMGRYLWHEHPVHADMVIPVPDSGNFAAFGLSKESGLPTEMALFRSHYVGRTFIEPLGKKRSSHLRIKFNVIPEIVHDKRVVLVDDSIVRASVMRGVIELLRLAGAKEIHVRISCPPYLHPCYYGIDTYRVKGELIAKRHGGDIEMIRREIGADSLGYLSLEKLKQAVSGKNSFDFCDACFSGNYHIPIK